MAICEWFEGRIKRGLTHLSRVWRWREPMRLGRIEDWPSVLIEGDYYRDILGGYQEIRGGYWRPGRNR